MMGQRPDKNVRQTTITLFPGDDLLIQWGMDFLKIPSQSEFIRRAVSAYVMHLEALDRRK